MDKTSEENNISDEVNLSTAKEDKKSFFSFLPWVWSNKNKTQWDAWDVRKWIDGEKVNSGKDVIVTGTISWESQLAEQNEEKWIFSKIFWKNNDESKEKQDTQNIETEKQEGESKDIVDIKPEDKKATPNVDMWTEVSQLWRNNYIGAAGTKTTAWGLHIMKSTNDHTSNLWKDSLHTKTAGVTRATKVGDIFNIWVNTLKLNNQTFTKTLAFLKRGDRVEQVSYENKYGCFSVLVLESSIANNIGKTWYVCKKYLMEEGQTYSQGESTVSPSSVAPTHIKKDQAVNTPTFTSIGSYYKTTPVSSAFNTRNKSGEMEMFSLPRWDILKQISEFNPSNGCAEMKVVGSAVESNHGKIVSICSLDLVTVVK